MGESSRYSKAVEVSQITGYEIMYCFKILEKTSWDINEAVKYLNVNPPNYKHYLNKDRYVLISSGSEDIVYDLLTEMYILIEDDVVYRKVVRMMRENNNKILNSDDIDKYKN